MKLAEFRGAYPADRAAALSGVPRSTIHYWARHSILVPSLSPSKVKLWSYTDLMGLRTIHWLRQRKITSFGWDIPPSTMPAVRHALSVLRELDLEPWTAEAGPAVFVDAKGEIYVETHAGPETARSGLRPLNRELLNLVEPFTTHSAKGPNLHSPRPNLRILPGKLSGEPHIVHTRIETSAVAALALRGFDTDQLARLYPTAEPLAIAEAIDLERQLDQNLRAAAA